MFDLLTQIEDKFDQAPFELVAGLLSLRMFWRKEAMKSNENKLMLKLSAQTNVAMRLMNSQFAGLVVED